MNGQEKDPVAEIHDIRKSLEEKMKHLTPQEYCKRVNNSAKEVIKKYGLKLTILEKIKH